MNFRYLRYIVIISSLTILLFGCATPYTPIPFKTEVFDAKHFTVKADNTVWILDASASMNLSHNGRKKLYIAKDILNNINQTLPDLDMNAGLIVFGSIESQNESAGNQKYRMKPYRKSEMRSALESVNSADGSSPLESALSEAHSALKPISGTIALLVVSDGIQMNDKPVMVANAMAKEYGDRLCIYTIQVGNSPEGRRLLERVAKVSNCGFSTNADELSSSKNVAELVRSVYLSKPMDSDADGVSDPADRCPGTPMGVIVDGSGCPLDADMDGVEDYLDKCPDSGHGVLYFMGQTAHDLTGDLLLRQQ